jgi:hypothetical protein
MCIVAMDVLHGSRRIFDADHQHLLAGLIREILQHELGYNGLRISGTRNLRDVRAEAQSHGCSNDS